MAHRAMRRLADTNYGQEVRSIAASNPAWEPTQIYEELRTRHGLRVLDSRPDDFPALRAVQSFLQRTRTKDESVAWTILSSPPEDTALVLPVLRAFNLSAKSRKRRPTVREAEIIMRIRRSYPDVPFGALVFLASVGAASPEDLASVEDYVAHEPWKDNGDGLKTAAADGMVDSAWFWPQEWAEEIRIIREAEWPLSPADRARIDAALAARESRTKEDRHEQ